MNECSAPAIGRGTRSWVRRKITFAYDGEPFYGFWPNQGVVTVGGELAAALQRVCGHPVRTMVAGRTDKGVHAARQVLSFGHRPGISAARISASLNSMLAPAISIVSIETVGPDFDARFSATARSYRYTVRTAEWPDPFDAATAWHIGTPLDLAAMNVAATQVLGLHDFSAFCRKRKLPAGMPQPTRVRRVHTAEWVQLDAERVALEIRALSFCHQMVRSLTGAMTHVGRGWWEPAQFAEFLGALDRTAGPPVAPAHGLCLTRVDYPDGHVVDGDRWPATNS